MSKTRVIVLALAMGSAGLAAMLAKGFIGNRPDAEVVEINKVPMAEVLIATKDLVMGERLVDGSIAWREWPQSNVVESMITKDEKPDALTVYQSGRARLPIFANEPLIDKKVVQPGQNGFMSAILPKGMRAISVGVSERSTAGGFILPNDRVDVLLTRKLDDPKTGQKIVNSETVIKNVRVLAINQTFQQETGDDKVTVTEGKTATLELDPRQTEVLAMVESAGELSLALRSIAENDGKSVGDTKPELDDKYVSDGEGGAVGGDLTVIRYGTESNSVSR